MNPKSLFIQNAQEYKPDILIPELSAAVEYKYATSKSQLAPQIAQISDDVKGYEEDGRYSLFYAVFYMTDDFWSPDRFDRAWKDKNFPANWRYVRVLGKGTGRSKVKKAVAKATPPST